MSNGTVTKWRRYVGDIDQITMAMGGLSSLLPGAVVTPVVIRRGVATAIVGASVTDAPNFEVTIPLTTWLIDATPGTYELQVGLDDTTWPDHGRAEITVLPSVVPTP